MRNNAVDLLYKPLRALNESIGRRARMRVLRYDDLYPWQIRPLFKSDCRPDQLPDGAKAYLSQTNPRLRHLEEAYRTVDDQVTRGIIWGEGKLSDDEFAYFRSHNPYVHQLYGLNYNELSYTLSYYALKSGGAGDLLNVLDEDGMFGVTTFRIDGRLVSRDLLDSVGEIDFIRRHVGLDQPKMNVLDVGAGYGRLPFRLTQASPHVRAFATDAFAPSTFLAEFYLKHRQADRAQVVPLNEVEDFLANTEITLATNIHSFSECTVEAIDWWVSRLARHGVKHLMIIPNVTDEASGHCLTNMRENMEEVFERYGYRKKAREPRYTDPQVQRFAVDPADIHLFGL